MENKKNTLTDHGITIISPYNGMSNLNLFLDSIDKQSTDFNLLEVIIVTEIIDDIVLSLKDNFQKIKTKIIHYERPVGFDGELTATLKNIGAKKAKYEQLLFIDSDCILTYNCITNYKRVFRNSRSAIICGVANELPFSSKFKFSEVNDSSIPLLVKSEELKLDYRLGKSANEDIIRSAEWHELYGNNFSISKQIYEELDGLDESCYRCDDTALGCKALLKGIEMIFTTKCSVIHLEHPRSISFKLRENKGIKQIQRNYRLFGISGDDQIINNIREYKQVIAESRERFKTVTNQIPGYQINQFDWMMLPSTESLNIDKLGLLYLEEERFDNTLFRIRIQRDCWDYSIIRPSKKSLYKPLVSVVIPCFNSSETIENAISSVLKQSLQSFELLIIDDGSSDDTVSHLIHFQKDPRVRVFSLKRNVGMSHILNKSLDLIHSEYLVQLDSDDELTMSALQKIYEAFKTDDSIAAVYGQSKLFTENGVTTMTDGYQVSSKMGFLHYEHAVAPRAFKSSVLKSINGWTTHDIFNGRHYEDKLILHRLNSKSFKIKYLPGYLYKYNLKNDSLSNHGEAQKNNIAKFDMSWEQANKYQYLINWSGIKQAYFPVFKEIKVTNETVNWSVIIPVHNRNELLDYSIKSWLESDWAENPNNEIIIVDDNSSMPINQSLSYKHPNIHIHRLPENKGPSYVRNLGVELAKNDMILFSDSDQIVPKKILSIHATKHKSCEEAIVVANTFGRKAFTRFLSSELHQQPLSSFLDHLMFDNKFEEAAAKIMFGESIELIDHKDNDIYFRCFDWTFLPKWRTNWVKVLHLYGLNLEQYPAYFLWIITGNISVHKRTFFKVGKFNEANWSCEDWEWGIRAQRKNIKLIAAPEAEVLHQVHGRNPTTKSRKYQRESLEIVRNTHGDFLQKLSNNIPSIHYLLPEFRMIKEGFPFEEGFQIYEGDKITLPPHVSLVFHISAPNNLTEEYLSFLAENNLKSIFFINRYMLQYEPEIYQKIRNLGHDVGISCDDLLFDSDHLTSYELSNEISILKRKITSVYDFDKVLVERLTSKFYYALKSHHFQTVATHNTHLINRWDFITKHDIIKEVSLAYRHKKTFIVTNYCQNTKSTLEALTWFIKSLKERNVGINEKLEKIYV